MIRRIRAFILEEGLFSAGDRIVVAVSGGPDSVALLDILVSLGMDLSLVVAHFNHRLRGCDADGDEEFVRGLAAGYGLPFHGGSGEVREHARRLGCGLEEAGRELRHRFFRELMAQDGAAVVAFGHHAEDQAETVLMRLLRGAGTRGLAGMAPRSGWKVRPLLGVRRAEILAHLADRKLSWRSDPSNADPAFLRNRIRHELLPSLESYNPAIVERLVTTASVCRGDIELLDAVTGERFHLLAAVSPGRVDLPLDELLRELPSQRLRLYERAVRLIRGDTRRLSATHLTDTDRLALSPLPHGHLDLPGIEVSRSYRILSFCRPEERPSVPEPFDITIPGEGEYRMPSGSVLRVRLSGGDGGGAGTWREESFDQDVAPFPWRVRSFEPGDRLSPFGMDGTKKVKELFMEHRVPVPLRRTIPILVDGAGRILSVCGVRRSRHALLTPEASRSVNVTLQNPAD